MTPTLSSLYHVSGECSLADANAYCSRLAKSHYENFLVVSWLLPRRLQQPMFNVYAYCRSVDDLGDEAEGDRLALLEDWEGALSRFVKVMPRDYKRALLDLKAEAAASATVAAE